MQYLISLGVVLAITGIVLILSLKHPLKVSDRLLILILAAFIIKFSLDEVSLIVGNIFVAGIAAVFGISSIITCGWYIKYITDTSSKFGTKQLIIYTPLLILLVLSLIALQLPASSPYKTVSYDAILFMMIGLIVYYFYFCIDMLRKHQQLIKEYYSGESGKLTVNWIIVILVLQISEFLLKGVLAHVHSREIDSNAQIVTNEYCYIIETFLLVVLGIWQKSVPVYIATTDDVVNAALQTDDISRYQRKLEKFMDEHKPYLDPELTIEKLSELTLIRKLSLSQTLNKGFNKNFFTFVKEYRIRHVEQMLKGRANEKATIMDIAYESGFNSKTGFNRAFKEVTGKTPTEYIGS